VEKSCVAKSKKGKIVEEKCCIIAAYAFPSNMEYMEVCDV